MRYCKRAAGDRELEFQLRGELLSLWMAWAEDAPRYVGVGGKFLETLDEQEIVWLLESRAGWTKAAGDLVRAALDSGVLVLHVDPEGGESLLVLTGFWEINSHLSPNAVSQQSRAAAAKKLKASVSEAQAFGEKQAQYLLSLERIKPEEAQDVGQAYQLVRKIERALGVDPMSNYPDVVIEDAIITLRKFDVAKVAAVCQFLFTRRSEPVTLAAVLRKFGGYLEKARDAKFI
jgi:hypothetical protein